MPVFSSLFTTIVLAITIRFIKIPLRILYTLLSDHPAKVGHIWIVVAALRKLCRFWLLSYRLGCNRWVAHFAAGGAK